MNLFKLGADLTVGLHMGFILFVAFGGFLVLRWPRLGWVHLPAAIWGAGIELGGWICPLTHLEGWLLERSGTTTYEGGFIDHYIVPVLYPPGLTRVHQFVIAGFVITINIVIYELLRRRLRRRRLSSTST